MEDDFLVVAVEVVASGGDVVAVSLEELIIMAACLVPTPTSPKPLWLRVKLYILAVCIKNLSTTSYPIRRKESYPRLGGMLVVM